MPFGRFDPGPCGICGAAHSACRGGDSDKHIPIVQLPLRDQAPALGLVAETVQAGLAPGQFTSATYRGKKDRV